MGIFVVNVACPSLFIGKSYGLQALDQLLFC
jgi:hypothetical protein